MGKEIVLPKNIRQIGDIQGKEKICIEDYVMTYIHKKEPQEEAGFLGIFLGERQETEEADYIFIRGILEIPQEEDSQKLKERLETDRAGYFPGWEIMGCCVIGVYPTKRLELLTLAAPEAERMIYHLQEQEENIYLRDQGNYRKIKGYLVFYEQNQKMQDYLAEIFGKDSVEKESPPDKAIKNFREKVKEKGERKSRGILKLASSFFVITVLAVGAIVVNRMDEIRTVSGDTGNSAVADSNTNSAIQYTAQNTAAGENAVQNIAAGDGAASQSAAASAGAALNTATSGDTSVQSTAASGGAALNTTASGGTTQSTVASGGAALNTATSGDTSAQSAAVSGGTAVQDTALAGTAGTEASQQDKGERETGETSAGTDAASSSWLTGSDAFWEDTADEEGSGSETEDTGTDAFGADDSATEQSEASETVSRQTQASYVIKAGDTLATICKKYYGSMERLEEICEANNITDADLILPGQKIVLP